MASQEPTNQLMKVTVWDKDFSGNEIIGRSLVKLAPVCKQEMQAVDSWYFLGPGDWADPAGCVSVGRCDWVWLCVGAGVQCKRWTAGTS